MTGGLDWWLAPVVCSPRLGRAPIAPSGPVEPRSGPDGAVRPRSGPVGLHLFSVKAASQAKAAARYDWRLGFVACLKLFTVKSSASLEPQPPKYRIFGLELTLTCVGGLNMVVVGKHFSNFCCVWFG